MARFVILVILLINCLLMVFDSAKAYSDIRPHRIRHLRHLLRKRSSLFYKLSKRYSVDTCEGPWRSIGPEKRAGCPTKNCSIHADCIQEYGTPLLCVCDAHLCGSVCMDPDRRCAYPRSPKNGKAILNDLKVGYKVEYTCEKGYVVKGPRKRYCMANLKLSGSEPACTNQTDLCFFPPYIPNSEVENDNNRKEYRNTESVKIKCQKGFEDLRNTYTNATCYGNQWKYTPLNCQRISCGKLQDPLNGRSMYMDDRNLYQSTALQFCNDGYTINCRNPNNFDNKRNSCNRVCQSNGKWSGKAAICTPILCRNLRAPLNGYMIGQSSRINSIRQFKCKAGFKLIGSDIRTCKLSGQWDGWEAKCKKHDCGKPPAVTFARVTYHSTTFNSVASYRCEYGTSLSGPSYKLTCKNRGSKSVWIPELAPKCFKHCRPLKISNGNVLIDNNSTFATFDLAVSVPHNANATVLCAHGFEPNKRMKPTCNNGTWKHVSRCVEAACPKRPEAEANSLVRFYSLDHGSVARYYCYYGYKVTEDYMPSRQRNKLNYYEKKCKRGQWVRVGGVKGCKSITCKNPRPPKNGEVILIGQADRFNLEDRKINLPHGRVLKFSCHPDYRLIGSKIIVCLNGKWSPPTIPTCEFIRHDKIPLDWLFYGSLKHKK